jgi:death-on-curing protein
VSEPIWLTPELVIAFHDEQLRTFGGPPGLRDRGMLESALDRPRNKWAYGETDLAALAASYAYGIARNHPFVDGNKRAAFLALMVFLRLNGYTLEVSAAEAAVAILALAAGDIDEPQFARWVRDRRPK